MAAPDSAILGTQVEHKQAEVEQWQAKHAYSEEQLERAYATCLTLETRAQDAESERGCIEAAHELERKHLAKQMAQLEAAAAF